MEAKKSDKERTCATKYEIFIEIQYINGHNFFNFQVRAMSFSDF